MITPAMLETAYEFLRATAPFRAWKLPPADEIEFRVSRDPATYGRYWRRGAQHVIELSARNIGHTATLMLTMAHEMIHLHQALRKSAGAAQHNAEFARLAERVCKAHGFDLKAFV